MKAVLYHWWRAIVVLILSVLAGSVLLPLARTSPESTHAYFSKLPDWIRVCFGVFLCILFGKITAKILAPRPTHLRFIRTHPPSWLAFLTALLIVATLDICGHLKVEGFDLEWWHWPLYGLLPLMYVALSSGFIADAQRLFGKATDLNLHGTTTNASVAAPPSNSLAFKAESIADAPWPEIQRWLQSDATANYDFLQNRDVAQRLTTLLKGGTRSIGLVGPFGAGKTSIVNWIEEELESSSASGPQFITCKFSCWGFETSSSVISEMLEDAIRKVGAEIDVFDVESLPDSYRQTFAAGGDWVERVSHMLLGKQSPDEQFERLSILLSHLEARILFIVEDLDRNVTRSFETEEVLAFLERLKSFDNLSFILTGGLGSTVKIDFAKLCDHIESLRLVDMRLATALIGRIRSRCADTSAFPHIPIHGDEERDLWSENAGLLLSEFEEMTLQQAVASLLRTPRSLRHSLNRTHSTWGRLCGEVNLDHLIVLNVIRHGAPEAFDWLLIHWQRLHSPPAKNSYGIDRTDQFKKSIHLNWQDLTRDADWNPYAVAKAIEFILPASSSWLRNSSGYGERVAQPISKEKYWLRAVNEALGQGAITDQEVAHDERAWNENQTIDSRLVTKLASDLEYSEAWKDLAKTRLAIQPSDCPLLLTQVFDRICSLNGASANIRSGGFLDAWQVLNTYIASSEIRRDWLKQHLTKAANISLRMASDLWHWCHVNHHGGSEAKHELRLALVASVKNSVTCGDRLNTLLDPDCPYTLYHLVFDSGEDKRAVYEVFNDWGWIGEPIRQGIQSGHESIIISTSILCQGRDGDRTSPPQVSREIFTRLFGDKGEDVIRDLLAMDASSQDIKAKIVRFATAARAALKRPPTDDDGGIAASDSEEPNERLSDQFPGP